MIKKQNYLKVESVCDLCNESMGYSLIESREYKDWLNHTTDLLTFPVEGEAKMLCWECIKAHRLEKVYDRRLNELTYGPKAVR